MYMLFIFVVEIGLWFWFVWDCEIYEGVAIVNDLDFGKYRGY